MNLEIGVFIIMNNKILIIEDDISISEKEG